ncbi:hypothetical protein HRbin36_01321 [bacterium HR36]|nr:hypothetical protein HRbin36_01321 [bacterium HR36]
MRGAGEFGTNLAVFNNELSSLENIAGMGKHFGEISLRLVECNIGISPWAKVSFISQTENAGGSGTGNNGDFRERVLPR